MSVSKDFLKKMKTSFKEKNVDFTLDELKTISEVFVETLKSEVSEGKTVKLLTFGVFSSSIKTFVNRSDQDNLGTPFRRFVVRFKSSTYLKALINEEIKKETSN